MDIKRQAVTVAAGICLLTPVGMATATTISGAPEIIVVGDMACDPADPYFNGGNGTATHCNQKAVSSAAYTDASIASVDSLVGVGDYQYDCGDAYDYQRSYTPTWGRFNNVISPAIGNHEYNTNATCPTNDSRASNYFNYFGASAHPETYGEYSYNLGSWLLISLNAECNKSGVGGCAAESRQTLWLKEVLAANAARAVPQPCIAAYWHQPLYTGNLAAPAAAYRPWWQALYKYGADLVLNGHVHNYQRYAPRNPYTDAVSAAGPTEYIVGTGGEALQPIKKTVSPQPLVGKETFGYLRMDLQQNGWTAEFVDTFHGNVVADRSSGTCH